MSSRQEIVEHKKKKAAEMQAVAVAAALKEADADLTGRETLFQRQTDPPVIAQAIEESLESGGTLVANKCARGDGDVIRTYTPTWGVLTTDRICHPSFLSLVSIFIQSIFYLNFLYLFYLTFLPVHFVLFSGCSLVCCPY